MKSKPTPPAREQLVAEERARRRGTSTPAARPAPVLRYAARAERNEKFRPKWVDRTIRDLVYDVLVEHWRKHGCNPGGIELSRRVDRPYTSVRAALVELRAEGRLIHKAKGVSVPVDCVDDGHSPRD